jgi:hypothetical protein
MVVGVGEGDKLKCGLKVKEEGGLGWRKRRRGGR